MGMIVGNLPYKKVELSGRIIRRDGTVEELGTIAYWHSNPLRRWAWHLRSRIAALFNSTGSA